MSVQNLINEICAIVKASHIACNNNCVLMAKEAYSKFGDCCIQLDRMGHQVGFTTSIGASGCIRIKEFVLNGDRVWGNERWTSLILLHPIIDEK